MKTVLRAESQVLMTENWRAYQLLTQGVPVQYHNDAGEIRDVRAHLIDWENPERNATLRGAFNQVRTYLHRIPDAFTWNQITVISDGVQARAGTFTAGWEHYAPWKTIYGKPDRGGADRPQRLGRSAL